MPTGDQVVAQTPYRDAGSGTDTVDTYLFSVDGSLTAGKTVAGITLPTGTDGDFHVFAVGFAQ